MAYLMQFGTTTTNNTNLNAVTLVHTQVNTTRIRDLWVNVFADQIKGGGDYTVYIRVRRANAGSYYEGIKTTVPVTAGITSKYFGSIPITLNATDLLEVWLLGLATDNDSTADIIVDVNEQWLDDTGAGFTAVPDTAGVTKLLSGLVPTNAAVNDAGASTTVFITTLASAVSDFYKGEAIVFTSGALTGQLGQIKSYNGATKAVTLQSALTSAPANGVTFVVATVAASRKFADFLAACDASGRSNIGLWLDVVPAILTATGKYLQVALQCWLTDNAAGTPLALTATHLVQADAIALNGGVPTNLTAQDVWDALVVALATPGSIGEFVVAFLDEIEHKVDDSQALICTK